MGAIYLDYRLVHDFNALVGYYNPGMRDDYRASRYRKLANTTEKDFFNYRAYPRIDIDSMELEWYVSNDVYKEYTNGTKYVTSLSK